jgi:hypothetical protein
MKTTILMKYHLRLAWRWVSASVLALTATTATAVQWKEDTTGRNGDWSQTFLAGVHPGWDGSVPNAVGAVAEIDNSTYDGAKVTLDIDATVGSLKSRDRNAAAQVLSDGLHNLTLQTSSGSAQIASSGRNDLSIAPGLVLANNLQMTISGIANGVNSFIKITGDINGSGNITVSQGGAGGGQSDLDFAALNFAGSLTISATAPSDTTRSARTAARVNGTIGSNVGVLTYNGSYSAASALYSTLELKGSGNAYSDTILNGGRLIVASTSNLGDGSLAIASGAKLTLNGSLGTIQGDVTALTLGGLAQSVPGTYGSTSSGADHQDNTYFDGTGMVKLVVPRTVITVR